MAAGTNPKEVAARAGHTSVSFPLDRYGHLLPGSEQRLNDALDALAEGTQATAEVANDGDDSSMGRAVTSANARGKTISFAHAGGP
jgi:hypothetical protein